MGVVCVLWIGLVGLVGVVEVWVRGVGINMKGEIIFLSVEVFGNVFPAISLFKITEFFMEGQGKA